MSDIKRFVVLRNNNLDGGKDSWTLEGSFETSLEAVEHREASLRNWGGILLILEYQPILEAYRAAAYQHQEEERKRNAKP